uniref:Saposin B-type domain-containing protein n=1 Tax=Panagrolaimus sp. PS1159 TaxID=55785 RepID=A0AC35F2W1_9BILA
MRSEISAWAIIFVALFAVNQIHANDSIMSCVLCEMVAESVITSGSTTPASALSSMYKRCAQMGLMEPVCDQLVDEHARQILGMARIGAPPKNICKELKLCDN